MANTDDRSLERRPPRSSKIERTLSKRTIFCQVNAFPSTILFAALADVYSPPLAKRNSTTCIPVAASSSITPPATFLSSTSQLELARNSQGKGGFERMCRNTGVTQRVSRRQFKTFTSAEFSRNLSEFNKSSDSLASALTITMDRRTQHSNHHGNARTMMLHSAIHWPDVADPHLASPSSMLCS
ncbi:hypothetical protein MHU86_5420 [Fragilaria crotonensis]|nr:hypothetical protein MHU86_5420 [Fragilaria crotonensis]